MMKNKRDIIVNPERCTECMRCQLICSFSHTGSFNPERSGIVIKPPIEIYFNEDCLPECRLCAQYCMFGALQLKEV